MDVFIYWIIFRFYTYTHILEKWITKYKTILIISICLLNYLLYAYIIYIYIYIYVYIHTHTRLVPFSLLLFIIIIIFICLLLYFSC